MPNNVPAIPSDQAEHLHRITITLEGIKTRDGAETALRGILNLTQEQSLAKTKGERQGDNYIMYPYICCWKSGGRWVWGVDLVGYCEYRGEGCPA